MILERDQLFYTSQDQSFRILFSIRSSPNCLCANCPCICLARTAIVFALAHSPLGLASLHDRLLASLLSHNLPPTNPRSACDRLARDQTRASSIHAEHPSALEVVVIGNQLNYLEALFYSYRYMKGICGNQSKIHKLHKIANYYLNFCLIFKNYNSIKLQKFILLILFKNLFMLFYF